MTTLYVLDVPENAGLVEVAVADPDVRVDRIGPYHVLSSDTGITIDRRATGCRHAVWYSAIAGIAEGTITQWDKDALRITPTPDTAVPAAPDRAEARFREAGLPA